jgi:hypothetical protein
VRIAEVTADHVADGGAHGGAPVGRAHPRVGSNAATAKLTADKLLPHVASCGRHCMSTTCILHAF